MKRNIIEEESELEISVSSQNSLVSELLKLKIDQFIVESVEENVELRNFLTPSSILTLCLLYLDNDSLSDNCHEKLKIVLHLACTNEKTCKFVVWCLLSILKEGSAHGFKDNEAGCWPAWIPTRNFDDQEVETNSPGVISPKLIDTLSGIVSRYSLCKEPNFEQFWEMAQNHEKIPDLENWTSVTGTKYYIVDYLFDLLENSTLSLKIVEDISKMIHMIRSGNPIERNNPKWLSDKKLTTINFNTRVRDLQKQSNPEISSILKLLLQCLNDLLNANFKQEKEDLGKNAEALCAMASKFGSTSELKTFANSHRDTIETLLVRYSNLEQLYTLVSKIPNWKISVDMKINYIQKVQEEGNHAQMWQILLECLIQLKTECWREKILKLSSAAETLYRTIVFDEITKLKFAEFVEEHQSTINAILSRKGLNRSFSDGKLPTLNFLFSALEPSKIEFETKVRNIKEVSGTMDKKQQLNLMSECIEKFKNETLETTRKEIAVAYLLLVRKFDEAQIYEITKRNKETINQMLRLVCKHTLALLFYSMFQKFDGFLEFDTRLRYFAKELIKLNEEAQWELLFEITPKLEAFENVNVDVTDLLSAVEILIPTIASADQDVNPIEATVFTFAWKHRELLNETLIKNQVLFSRGALLSILHSQIDLLRLDVISKYITIWEGKRNESVLWNTLGYCLSFITQNDLALQVSEKICDYLQKIRIDEKLRSDFVAKNHLIINKHVQQGNVPTESSLCTFFKSIPKLFSFETKKGLIGQMSHRELRDFLDESFHLFQQSAKSSRMLIVPTVESICSRIRADSNSIDQQLTTIFAKYSQVIGPMIPYRKCDLHTLLAKSYPKIILDVSTLRIETKKDIVEEMDSIKLCDFLNNCFDVFDKSSKSTRVSVMQTIELVSFRIITHSSIENQLTKAFEQYLKLISNEILPNWNQCDIKSLHILLIKNYPKIVIDSTLSIQAKAKLMEHMSLDVSCDFLQYCLQSFDQSSNDEKRWIVPIINTVSGRVRFSSGSIGVRLNTILAEYHKLIATMILPNWGHSDLMHLIVLLAKRASILLDYPELSNEVKTAIIKNMSSYELYDFLQVCFDIFEETSNSKRDLIVPIIESICACTIALNSCAQDQLTRIFARYSKLIFDEIISNCEQCEIKSLHTALTKNYPIIVINSITSIIGTETELVENMSLSVSCNFLKYCFQSFDQSSNNARSLIIPIIESVCGRIIACSGSVEKRLTTIFKDHSKLIVDTILPSWNHTDKNLLVLLANDYPRMILDFPKLKMETKTALMKNMKFSALCDVLEECFQKFEGSSKNMKDVIVATIEYLSIRILENADRIGTQLKKHSNLIADQILPKWKHCETKCFHALLGMSYPRIIVVYITLSNETKETIVENMKSEDLCGLLSDFFCIFAGSSESTKSSIVPIIESLCERINDHAPNADQQMPKIFAKHAELIADVILSNWNLEDVESLHILLANHYPKIILTFPTLSTETKMAIVEDIQETQLCGFLEDCLNRVGEFYNNIDSLLIPIIQSICCRLSAYPIYFEELTTIFDKYSKLIADEILPKYQSDVKSLQFLLKKTCNKMFANFTTRLASLQQRLKKRVGTTLLTIDRRNVLNTSYNATSSLTLSQWMSSFRIRFLNEPGIDAGGLLREWFTITTREILNPNYGFFTTAPGDINCYMINKSSYINEDHLNYFTFFGRFLAKGIIEAKHVNCHFTKALYKHVLGIPVKYSDFQSEDPTYFKSLDFLINNPVKDAGLDLTFTVEVEEFGVLKEKELMHNGKNVEVTDENKNEYVTLVSHMKMTESIQQQLDAFLGGFYDIIPKHEIKNFYENELEMMLCGPSEIDIDDLKANTVYTNYQVTDNVIQWFWRALRSFTKDDQAKFLMFTTGSFKAPLNGFATLQGNDGVRKFCIHKDGAGKNRLPRAHTCFNQLDLPQYDSYDQLREKLLLAIREGTEGFEIV